MKNDPNIKKFGKNLRRLRLKQGWTQEQLAEKADFHVNYIGLIENGQREANIPSILKIAKALRCDISELFKGLL